MPQLLQRGEKLLLRGVRKAGRWSRQRALGPSSSKQIERAGARKRSCPFCRDTLWNVARGESVERLHAALCYAYQPVVLGGRELHEKIVDGVNRLAVVDDFVVEVRGERESGVARKGDDVSPVYFLSPFDRCLAEVSVAGLITVAVVYRYGQSRRGVPSGSLRDRTVCRGKDAGTFR